MPDLAGRAGQTHISRLRLTDFRNYASLSLDLEPGLVVFSGDNGAGKTNLLEAISLLSPGRGLRRATYEEVAREGQHRRLCGLCADSTGRSAPATSAPAPPAGSPAPKPDGGCASTPRPNPPRICSNGCACCG